MNEEWDRRDQPRGTHGAGVQGRSLDTGGGEGRPQTPTQQIRTRHSDAEILTKGESGAEKEELAG